MSQQLSQKQTWPTWRTAAGENIQIRWMQSTHLVHTMNKVIRDNDISRHYLNLLTRGSPRVKANIVLQLHDELKQRGLAVFESGPAQPQYKVPNVRETPTQLCILRAILDAEHAPKIPVSAFYENPQKVVDTILENGTLYPDLVAKFAEYRLEFRGLQK